MSEVKQSSDPNLAKRWAKRWKRAAKDYQFWGGEFQASNEKLRAALTLAREWLEAEDMNHGFKYELNDEGDFVLRDPKPAREKFRKAITNEY